MIKPEFWDFEDEPDIKSDLRRIEIEKYNKMPPKGSSKRKRPSASAGAGTDKENKEEIALSALPKDSTPPPNFVMEQAHAYHVDHPHHDPSTSASTSKSTNTDTEEHINLNPNPDANPEILDARSALRASPDADEVSDIKPGEQNTEEFELGRVVGEGEVGAGVKEDAVEPSVEAKEVEGEMKGKVGGKRGRAAKGANAKKGPEVKVVDQAYPTNSTSADKDTIEVKRETTPLATVQNTTDNETETTPAKKGGRKPTKASVAAKKGADEIKAFVAAQAKVKKEPTTDEDASGANAGDGDNGGDGPDGVTDDMDAREREAKRPPPVNSDYLPLPWKGRLGYACLNTYLRFSNPPVFASRTCRIQSILDHRYPLTNPDEPEHATKNRPDKTKTPSVERGMEYVQSIGLANARDCVKMIRWNDKYGIRFMRLSSEMFPFASHEEYGYTLEGFAKEVLGEVGKVAAEVGCRLTTHPGQVSREYMSCCDTWA